LKLHFIIQTLLDSDIHIACITESWLNDGHDHTIAVLNSFGFSISHSFRATRKGGGVAILLRKEMKFKKIVNDAVFDSFEWHGIKYLTRNPICILCIYRKQEFPMALFLQELNNLMTSVCGNSSDQILLTGDFNVHFETNDRSSQDLKNLAHNFGLQQNVSEPTHTAGHMLDLIFSNPCDSDIKVDVRTDLSETTNSLIKFDHFPILVQWYLPHSLIHNQVSQNQLYIRRNISGINLDQFSSYVHQQLDDNIPAHDNFKDKLAAFNTCLTGALDLFAPPQIRKSSANHTNLPEWFDAEYIKERRLRRRQERLKNRLGTEEAKQNYIKQRDHCVILANNKIRLFYSNIISKSKNQSALFKTVSKLWNNNKPRMLPDHDCDLEVLADKFNHQFVDKVKNIRDKFAEQSSIPDPDDIGRTSSVLHTFEPATIEELTELISEMDIKASFDDPLPSALYKPLVTSLLPYIIEIVNTSLKSGDIAGLKESIITHVLKKAGLDHNLMGNYRPITNLQFLSKLIEKVVLKRLNSHMTTNNLHCSSQFGYKKHHSTEALLLQVVDETLVGFDKRNGTVLILLDMSAAFDTVDLNKLLKILEKRIGLRGTVLKWFHSFLIGRSQKVKVAGVVSQLLATLYCVPQGSVLGPVLFNIYVSSLPGVVKQMCTASSSYADDTNARIQLSLKFQYSNISVTIPLLLQRIGEWMNTYFLKTTLKLFFFFHHTCKMFQNFMVCL